MFKDKKEISSSPLTQNTSEFINAPASENAQFEDSWVRKLFRKLAFLSLDDQQKQKVSLDIVAESHANFLFWTQIVLSTLIASFGLLQGSVAVIIGAMLISPFLRPIKALAFGLVDGQHGTFFRSLRILFFAGLLTIVISFLAANAMPLRLQNSEILARTVPNLLDLFIALASAVLALLAIKFPKLSETVAGVAMASALLPPLAVVGIEISLQSWNLALGALLLFSTNILAIILVAISIFVTYGFYPHQKNYIRSFVFYLVLFLTLLTLITFQLISALTEVSTKADLQNRAQIALTEILGEQYLDFQINQVNILSFDDQQAVLQGEITLPEGLVFFGETENKIRQSLATSLQRDVQVELKVLRTASVMSMQSVDELNQSNQISREFENFLNVQIPNVSIIKVSAEKKTTTDSNNEWLIRAQISPPLGQEITLTTQEQLAEKFAQIMNLNLQVSWELLARQAISENIILTPREEFLLQETQTWQQIIQDNLPDSAILEDLKISWNEKDPNQTFNINNIESLIVEIEISKSSQNFDEADFENLLKSSLSENQLNQIYFKIRYFDFLESEFAADESWMRGFLRHNFN